jgi:hypothetical protein
MNVGLSRLPEHTTAVMPREALYGDLIEVITTELLFFIRGNGYNVM